MKPLKQITIFISDDGDVQVANFPNDLRVTLDIFYKATLAIINYFMETSNKKNNKIIPLSYN